MLKKHLSRIILGLSFLACFFTTSNFVLAQNPMMEDPLGIGYASASGLQAHDPRFIVGRIINVALGLLGTVAIILVIYAGFLWMTAGGNDDQIGKAKGILTAAIIGLVIILTAYTITNFVLGNLFQATQGMPYGS